MYASFAVKRTQMSVAKPGQDHGTRLKSHEEDFERGVEEARVSRLQDIVVGRRLRLEEPDDR
jgi:hypothetical protein